MSEWPQGWFRDERPGSGRRRDPAGESPQNDRTDPDLYRSGASSPPAASAPWPSVETSPSASAPPPGDAGTQAVPQPGQRPGDPTAMMPRPGAPTGGRPAEQIPYGYGQAPPGPARGPGGPGFGGSGSIPPGMRPPTLKGPDGGYTPVGGFGTPAPRPQRRRMRPLSAAVRTVSTTRRLVRLVMTLLVLLLVFYAGLGVYALARLDRIDALESYSGRPADTPGQTWLLVGSDSREGLTAAERKRLRTGNPEGQRTDTILLLHIPDSGRPSLVSLPRDSFVRVPAHGRRAEHNDKLNAAYSIGGAPLIVKTVERATGLRIDNYAEVGFAGVAGTTDAVGGVRMCLPRAINYPLGPPGKSSSSSALRLPRGCHVMDGPTALSYVRARYGDPKGDLGRVERQRKFISALIKKSASPSTLLNPIRTTRLATAATDALTVDNSTGPLDLLAFRNALRAISRGDGDTITVPIADTDYRSSAGSAVLWDSDKARAMFRALAAGRRPAGAESGAAD